MAILVCIPTSSVRGFLFLHTLSSIYCLETFFFFRFFDSSHSNQHDMVPHRGFDLHFSDNEWCWASCHVFLAICISSLEKCLFSSLVHFWLGHLFFWNWDAGVACIFLRLIVCQLLHLLLFSLILMGYLLALFIVSFIVQKLLSLITSHLLIFIFISIILGNGS